MYNFYFLKIVKTMYCFSFTIKILKENTFGSNMRENVSSRDIAFEGLFISVYKNRQQSRLMK